jgi:glycosyltransferase involved in cell wall biosynthesis
MQKLLFISNDYIGSVMAGPGIRYWEMARALEQKGHEVTVLARHVENGFFSKNITFIGKASFLNLIKYIRRADCVIQPGRPVSILFGLLFRKKLIFDQYDPVIFEFLGKNPDSLPGRTQKRLMLLLWKIRQRIILRFGDSFLVANEKQKDFLIGQMTLIGHSNKLESITVLPFGLPDAGPVKRRPVLRGTKIKDTDFLLVWGGGIWDWFDPFTLLHAISKIQSKRDDIKVYFPGIMPPSPDSRKMAVVDKFLAEAKTLGLLETAVFVNAEWTPYDRRADYLLEADAGISLHLDTLETRFAFRTRMLDYLWAGLPIIASQGDSWADSIENQGLGITVAAGDVEAVAAAIIKMADDETLRKRCRERTAMVAAEYKWKALIERLPVV